MSLRPKQILRDRTRPLPPTPGALCRAPTAREAGLVKPFLSPVRDTRARATEFYVSYVKLSRGVCYACPLFPASYLSRAPRLQAASLRKILYRQGGGTAVTRWETMRLSPPEPDFVSKRSGAQELPAPSGALLSKRSEVASSCWRAT